MRNEIIEQGSSAPVAGSEIDWARLGGAIPGFDCVRMKDDGAALVRERVQGMTLEQELSYWQQRSAELKEQVF